MRIHLSYLPDDIIQHYKLHNIIDIKGYVYTRIDKGMYGLKQAGQIAFENFVKHMKKYGYYQYHITKGL